MLATAAILIEPKKVVVERIELPKPNHGQVLVQIKKATLCPTDIKKFNADKPDVEKTLKEVGSCILGHEASGVVVEIGSDITEVKIGDRVAIQPMIACGHCEYCLQKKTNMCVNLLGIGASAGSFADCVNLFEETGIGGCFATHLLAPESCVVKIPDSLSFEEGSLFEPLADVIHSVDAARVSEKDTVVIIGMGPMGLMHIPASRFYGARRIFCVDISAERLKIAKVMGASETIDSSSADPVSIVKKLTNGIGANKIFVTAGGRAQNICTRQAINMAAKKSTVSLFASAATDADDFRLSLNKIHYSMINLTGTVGFGKTHGEKAIELLASREFDYKQIRNREFPLQQIENAIELYGKGNNLKVGIDLSSL